MNDMWWSWILTVVGLTGFILAGRKVWWCWYINIACQFLWFTYAIVTEQYGFIIASLAYTYVFTQNAIKWTKEHLKKMNYNEVAVPSHMEWQENFEDLKDLGSDHQRVEVKPDDVPERFKTNNFETSWCGQTQPHPPHTWAKGYMGLYTNCSGHA